MPAQTADTPSPADRPLVRHGFRVDRASSLAYLSGCLRDVLVDLGEHEAARHVDDAESVPPAASGTSYDRLAQVDSVWFQLLNMVEELVAGDVRKLREAEQWAAAEPGLWGRTLAELAAKGLEPSQVAGALQHVRVEPVLTAHPTEAKPSTVIEQHRSLFVLLGELETLRTDVDRQDHRERTKAALERLWRTGEILLQKPDLAAERANLLFYLREVFPDAVADVDRRLQRAWRSAGYPPLDDDPAKLPQVSFGFWAGGDRDGHPGVTHSVTRRTFGELRRGAISSHAKMLLRLGDRLSLSSHVQTPPDDLVARVEELARMHPTSYEEITTRHPNEPWRHLALLMRAHLPPPPGKPGRGEGESHAGWQERRRDFYAWTPTRWREIWSCCARRCGRSARVAWPPRTSRRRCVGCGCWASTWASWTCVRTAITTTGRSASC